MSKKKHRQGLGGPLRQQREFAQWPTEFVTYLASREDLFAIENYQQRLDIMQEFFAERAEMGGIQELGNQVKYLFETLRTQYDLVPQMTQYKGDDPLAEKTTFISYVVTFTDNKGLVKIYKENHIPYPAPIDKAIAEVVTQFIWVAENGPTPEDFGNKQVDTFNIKEMLRILAHLWHYRRLSPEEYEDERNRLFDEHWSQITDPDLIDQRKQIKDQYRNAVKRTFLATEQRLAAKRGSIEFREQRVKKGGGQILSTPE